MDAVEAWPVLCAPYGAVGRGWSPGPHVDAVGACLVTWAPCGRRGSVVGPLELVWPLWERGRSPGPCVADVGAWPVLWAPCGRCGGVAGPLGPVWLT